MIGRPDNAGGIPGLSGRDTTDRPAVGHRDEPLAAAASTHSERPSSQPERPREPYAASPALVRGFVVVTIAALAWMFVAAERSSLADPVQQGTRGEITATSSKALTQPANLAHALRVVRAGAPARARVTRLDLSPIAMSIQLVGPDGAMSRVKVDLSYDATTESDTGARPSGLPLASFPSRGPARLLRDAERDLNLRAADLKSITLNAYGSDGPSWRASYSRPLYDNDADADLDGSHVRRPGAPRTG